MATITATIKFVNDPKPGKKNGTLKLANDELIGVIPGLLPPLRNMVGRTLTLEYDTHTYQGREYRTVNKFTEAAPPPSNSGSAAQAGAGGYNRPTTAPVDAKRMFVTKILGDMITSGRIDILPDTLISQIRMLERVWNDTIGSGQQPSQDMDDQIGY